ncbi:MAG: insulinase family protein [Paludibacteraceae bacterium]|nr:insulinase family protein [Paludibacteraceae bacterium]
MKKFFFSSVLLLAALSGWAQKPLPVEKDVRIGHLDNGLTYYIRHNETPKQRCEFHIAQAVGAVLEEDDQNGLAHFLEHMAFNGTEHFAEKGIIEYFESIGVNFGGNINAYTSIDETVYRLSDVPTVREGIIDTALLVMHDWACGLLLDEKEIDNERGVIREEWRTRNSANYRMWSKMMGLKYPGTQYGKRDVIGDTAVINNFAYDALRAYYKKWYGPDNQAIIVVGDIDVDQIEQKIKALWANVPERANRGERPLYTVPFNTEPRVCIVTDKEAQSSSFELDFLHEQMPKELENTDYAYRRGICLSLITRIIDNRFYELSLEPDAPFKWGGIGYGEVVKLRDAFIASIGPKEGHELESYKVLLEQLEKMQRYGFTQSELERAKTNYLNSTTNSYNSRGTRDNISYAREYIRNFEDHESIPGIEWEYNFVKETLPTITAEELLEIARKFMHNNPIICVTGPDKEGVVIPTEQTLLSLYNGMPSLDVTAPTEEVLPTTLVRKAPKAGKIKKVEEDPLLGTTEWLLSNGIKVVFKPTKYEENQISLHAFAKGGGTSLYEGDDLISAIYAADIVSYMGLGEFSKTDLSKVLTGKSAGAGVRMGTLEKGVWGSSTKKDFETMLQLLYLRFTAPRRDEKAFTTWMNQTKDALINKELNHKSIFRDSVSLMASNHSDRTFILTQDKLEKIDLDKMMKIYKERFSNPAEFTYIIVGDINPEDEAVKKAVCQWLGSLKTNKRIDKYIDHQVRVPQGIHKNYFSRKMEIHQATNRIQYTAYGINYTLDNALNMEMIGRILSTRYLESIREREGGSYGVGCGGWMDRLPVPRAVLVMQFDTDPEKQERLMQIIHEEVMTIVENGPLDKDLQKEKESMLKDFQENKEKNWWWRNTIEENLRYGGNALTEYVPAVNRITKESVQTMLKQLVEAGNMFEVVMFPEK